MYLSSADDFKLLDPSLDEEFYHSVLDFGGGFFDRLIHQLAGQKKRLH